MTICPKCNEEKELIEARKICQECYDKKRKEKSEYDKIYNQKNREKRKKYNAEYRETHKEEIDKRELEYRQKNREKLAEVARRYNASHREERRQYARDHRPAARISDKKKLEKIKKDPVLRKMKQDWYKRYRLARRYGMTLQEYDAMLESQNGKCAICNCPPSEGRDLCVDHNHETGKVRGLLCDLCNKGIGQFGDSAERIESAMLYIKKHNQQEGVCPLCAIM